MVVCNSEGGTGEIGDSQNFLVVIHLVPRVDALRSIVDVQSISIVGRGYSCNAFGFSLRYHLVWVAEQRILSVAIHSHNVGHFSFPLLVCLVGYCDRFAVGRLNTLQMTISRKNKLHSCKFTSKHNIVAHWNNVFHFIVDLKKDSVI